MIAIDLFCGLGGWTDGLLAEGWSVIGFDIERHEYVEHRYPAQLVLQDVLTLHGSQFRDADLIVASPPCQEFSWMAMPWSKAKAKARHIAAHPEEWLRLTALFDACFRIQREASEAAGRHIPLIVENVRGAQRWVGRSRWNYGSFHLWGDVPALMPMTMAVQKFNPDGTAHPPGSWFAIADSKNRGLHTKNTGGSWFNVAHNTTSGKGRNLVDSFKTEIEKRLEARIESAPEGVKTALSGHAWYKQGIGSVSSGSSARKAASAMIAKIPLPLSRHIAQVFKP